MQQVVLLILMPLILVFVFWTFNPFAETHRTNQYVALIIPLVLEAFMLYMLLKLATARLTGDQLILKKLFGAEIAVPLKEITRVESFKIKRTSYLSVRYQFDGQKEEKVWIMKPSSFLSDRPDPEDVLRDAINRHSGAPG